MDLVCGALLTGMFMPIFNIGLGMSTVAIGIVMVWLRAWDAINDPLMGYISDNFPTRWGRRRPYLVIGAIGSALVYPLFWFMPPELSESGKFFYLLIVGLAFYTVNTVWAMPYYSLQMELTPNYHERTRLTAWMTAFYSVVNIFAGWNMALITSKHFADPVTGKPDLVNGMQTMGWFYAGLIVVFGLAPALLVKERAYTKPVPAPGHDKIKRESFLQSLRESFSNGPLWLLIAISFFLVVGTSVGVGGYVHIFYVCDGDLALAGKVSGYKSTIITISSLALIPFWTWLGRYYDKKNLVITTLLISIFGHLLGYYLITPANPYLSLISGFFESSALSAIWLFLPSMKGDVCDYDEQSTWRRREGGINSFYSWFFKAALTLTAGLSGWVIQMTGFNVKVNSADPVIHERLFNVHIFLPVMFWMIALVFAWFYPLTRTRMAAIRKELEDRRGAVKVAE
ncbi:MAG: MFS transporter [Opitutaceae bacterium]|nr:MFS transporter [Opitutaceae bacterium]